MTTVFHIICLLLKFSSTFSIDKSLVNETQKTNDDKTTTIESTYIATKIYFEDFSADIATNELIKKGAYTTANSIKNSTDHDNSNWINATRSISEIYKTKLHENLITNSTLMNIADETSDTLDDVPINLSNFSSNANSFDEINSIESINQSIGNISDSNYNDGNDESIFNIIENEIEISSKNVLGLSENVNTSNKTIAWVDLFDGGDGKSLINDDDKFDSQNITENEREERNTCADCTPSTDGIYQDISYEPRHVKRDEEKSMYTYKGNSIHKQRINGNVLSSTENVLTVLPTFQDVYTQYRTSTESITYTENILNYLDNGDVSTVSGNDDKDIDGKYENLTITNATFELDIMSSIPTNGSISMEQQELEEDSGGGYGGIEIFTEIDSEVVAINNVTSVLITSDSDNDSVVTMKSDVNINSLANFSDTTWPVKHSAVVEGDLILGGLMMVHSREDTITCGPIMPQGGIQALEAMLFTIDRINEIGLLPNIKLGAHILDDCDKDTYGLEMAVDFIKDACIALINNSDNEKKMLKKRHSKLTFNFTYNFDNQITYITLNMCLKIRNKSQFYIQF